MEVLESGVSEEGLGVTVMSEILQSVHSLAVTNEVIKQRSGEEARKCFSPLPTPR